MHFFHPTPLDIVEQYIASRIKGMHFDNVLDPCVGDGALLTSLQCNFNNITIVDIDSDRLNKFNETIFTKYYGDFLNLDIGQKFDLILCNPPFNNKFTTGPSVEEKFLKKCLQLLNTNGYGIFILPSSIINGTKSKQIRENLVRNYKILSIDILPKKTFLKIESHFYIILMKNIKPSGDYNFETNIETINTHSIYKNNYSTLNPINLLNNIKYECFLKKFSTFDLSSTTIFRGNIEKKISQLHTTDFSSYVLISKVEGTEKKDGKNIKKYDLLCKRVGRNCHLSFAISLSKFQLSISDCIVVITPNLPRPIDNIILLLNIRLSILLGASFSFLIDGSGANYISINKLKQTKFIDFRNYLSKKNIKKFSYLLIKRDIIRLSALEIELKKQIMNYHQKVE